ncbi:MAG: hypothetical protein Q8927_18300 [Bacteroidota bacterium]|nr:hypothetical protein [Bacteroidota bacterium]
MKFRYAEKFGENKEKWAIFDAWLEKLSDENPDEFSKEIYKPENFIQVVGSSTDGHIATFVPHRSMPKHISDAIVRKLLQLWPPD